ncbi:AAA family ATPase [Nocardia terpenica]|uniref:AAA family ATPase n=1 Tax=Nocardia terpenica TaxID=455432 RepID=A0A291RU38_9NOCA|nr:AAA family ATPase [Nocardia terpenica]ATL70744.1 hypothetical protein CRH09_35755 [Nocardia terpenica]
MTELVITRGYPGSGKTTYARQWASAEPCRAKAPSRDDLRAAVFEMEGQASTDQERAITAAQTAAVRALVGRGLSVIVDDTNLRARHARLWADVAAELGAQFRVVDIKTPVDQCLARNEYRRRLGGRCTDPAAIRDMAERFPIEQWPEIEPAPASNIGPCVPRTVRRDCSMRETDRAAWDIVSEMLRKMPDQSTIDRHTKHLSDDQIQEVSEKVSDYLESLKEHLHQIG